MTFLLQKDFRIGFFTGFALHVWFVFWRVKWLQFKCDPDCGSLGLADMPVSVLYFAFPDGAAIVFSLILGSIVWGFWFYFLLKLVRWLVGRIVRK